MNLTLDYAKKFSYTQALDRYAHVINALFNRSFTDLDTYILNKGNKRVKGKVDVGN